MKSITIFFLLFIFSLSIYAQSPDKILKQAEKALGGKKSLQSISFLQKKGAISFLKDGTKGQFLSQIAKPNFYNEIYDLNGIETETGYNGKSGWQRSSRNGLQTLTGNAGRDLAVEADFYNTLWFDYKKEKAKISSGGTSTVNGKPANIVVLTSLKGVAIKMFFDAATFLPVREEIPSGDTLKVYDFDDYRVVNNVKIPFSIQLKLGEDVYQIKLEDVRINEQIAKSEFDFPKLSNEPLPDIASLLQRLRENTDNKIKILDDYNYQLKATDRELADNGILQTKESSTYTVSFYKGFQVSRLIEKNDKPLSEKDQKKADEDAQKRLEEIDKYLIKKAKKEAESGEKKNEGNFYSEILKASNLINPRRERFRGRDVIVFDFEPNPNFDYKNAKSIVKIFGKTLGVMWIDEKDKEVVRMEVLLGSDLGIGGGALAKVKKGASMIFEQDYVNNEVWLPSSQEMNFSIRVFLVKGINQNSLTTYYNYHKFKSEVTDSKVDEVKKP
jgi:uncharacterized protein (UPF0254 family)